jgi:uncharacterized damage-inducible protein DinB
MTIDDIHLLFEYDRWANHRVLQAASDLSTEQFTRDLGGAFSSIRDTLVHIIAGEWVWLEYWKAPAPDSAFLASLRTRRESLFSSELFPDLAAVRRKWSEVEKQQLDFVNGLTDAFFNKVLPFRSMHAKLAHLMQHVANHSTYHRGQISLMMRQLGAKPVATDFHEFLVMNRGESSVGNN